MFLMRKAVFIIDKVEKAKIEIAKELGFEWIFAGGKNLNQELINNIHKMGMKVVAETGMFIGDDLWEKYSDCRPIDRNGKPIEKVYWYGGVCPNHPGVREERLTRIRQLINNLDVDGIWLDFIRYPNHWEDVRGLPIEEYCFCENCRKLYGKNDFGSERWYEWKADQIVGFVGEVKNIIEKSGRNIELGLFGVPWIRGEFDDAIINIIGQDFKKLALVIDVFTPMTYQLMCDRTTQWINDVVVSVANQTGKPVLPIIQTEDKPVKLNKKEFEKEIIASKTEPSIGSIIFFLEDLLKDPDKVEVVKKLNRL